MQKLAITSDPQNQDAGRNLQIWCCVNKAQSEHQEDTAMALFNPSRATTPESEVI